MKVNFLVKLILFSFLLAGLCACSGSPYGGEWEEVDNEDNYFRFELRPGKEFLMKKAINRGLGWRGLTSARIQKEMEKDNRLAIETGEGPVLFEPLPDDKMLLKFYHRGPSLEDVLNEDAPEPYKVLQVSRRNPEYDKSFEHMIPSMDLYATTWSDKQNPGKEMIVIEPGSGNLKILNPRLIKRLGGKTEFPLLGFKDEWKGKWILSATFYYPDNIEISVHPNSDEIHVMLYAYKGTSREFHLPFNTTWNEEKKGEFEKYLKAISPYNDWIVAEEARIKKEREESKKAEEQEAAAREAEEKKLQAEREAAQKKAAEERKKAAQEKRAKVPDFSFATLSLTDTPSELVKKGLSDYRIITTFPVKQSAHQIETTEEVKANAWGYIKVLPAPVLAEFFNLLTVKESREFSMRMNYAGYPMEDTIHQYAFFPTKQVLNTGLRLDSITLIEKDDAPGRTRIYTAWYTLPGEQPTMLFMTIYGSVIKDAVEVFTTRYGEPEEHVKDGMDEEWIWRSVNQLAFAFEKYSQGQLAFSSMTLVSQPAFDKYAAYLVKIAEAEINAKKAREEAKKVKEKAREEARKSKI